MGKEKISAAALTLGAVINISLNVFAVKEYGQVGASTVKIITEVFAFLFQLYFIHRVLPFRGTYASLRGGT
jgi:O-antigen/teichoic acid export membrane protein